MSKYLTMLTSANGVEILKSNRKKYSFMNMDCGNGYKEGLKHLFESSNEEDIKLLVDIIRRFKFDTKIKGITPKSFIFETSNMKVQIFLFRICRYVRTNNIKKILLDTIKINKAGVRIQNAFLLAHYYNYTAGCYYMTIPYYAVSMDGFHDASSSTSYCLNKPFKTLKEFKLQFETCASGITYNNLFKYSSKVMNAEKKLLFELLDKNDFKAAEKYLLKVYK